MVAALYLCFCLAALTSSRHVKRSKNKVKRGNDICLAQHQGVTGIPNMCVCFCVRVCMCERERANQMSERLIYSVLILNHEHVEETVTIVRFPLSWIMNT